MVDLVLAALVLFASPDAGNPIATPDLAKGLPWEFDAPTSATLGRVEEDWHRRPNPFAGATAGVSWHWRSKKPIDKDGRRKIFLHIWLGRLDYGDATSAQRGLSTFLERVDPEMGYSYAWDYVVADGRYLWHLGAPCLWARANFDKLVANLVGDALGGRKLDAGMAAYCACGSGCRKR